MPRPEPTLLALLGSMSLANGLWMLFAPRHWYETLPAAVPDYGPYNAHFVRDVGAAFLVMGAALVGAVVRVGARVELTGLAAAFAVLHAAIHVFDTAGGHVGSHHWMLDLPGVYLPAVVLPWLVWRASRGGK